MRWRIILLSCLLLGRAVFNYLVTQTHQLGSHPQTMDVVAPLRSKLVAIAEANLPEPESALVLGIVLGYKSSLGERFYQALVESGTLHMVVASGYNVMIVAGLALSAFLIVFKRWPATLFSIAFLFFYVLLTEGEISIIRATLMGMVVFVGQALGRGSRGWWSLLLVVTVMVLLDPLVFTSISFQLSVTATFGVVVLAPHISKRVMENSAVAVGGIEKLDLSTSLAALLATWPVIWFHFGGGSLISLVSNSLILPLVPLVMALGGVMLIAGLIFAPLGLVMSWPTYALAHLVVILVRLFPSLI